VNFGGVVQDLAVISRELSETVNLMKFSAPITHVYNPLTYARAVHEEYLSRFGTGQKRIVFWGMNPGPWGMAQTGVPFGEIAAVRDWMGIHGPVGKPDHEHPKRPIEGFACARSEVSGRRLWGLMESRFESAEQFFREHLVMNYCPLVFMEESGRNHTPDKLTAAERTPLFEACDHHVAETIRILNPVWVIGIGAFALSRIRGVVQQSFPQVQVATILHPSPASPRANSDWSGVVSSQLAALGVWPAA